MNTSMLLWGLPSVAAFILSIAALFSTKICPGHPLQKSKAKGFVFWMLASWALSGLGSMLQQWFESHSFSWTALLTTLFFMCITAGMYMRTLRRAK